MRVFVLGGTDITIRLLEQINKLGLDISGGVHLGRDISISYAPKGVSNQRYADVGGWYSQAGIPSQVFQDTAATAAFAQSVKADFCLVAGWYHMVPAFLRDVFAKGCVGIHSSLLPKLRGGAPLNWAILLGETQAGVSLFELGDGVDDGAIYGQIALPIGARTTITELVEASAGAAARLIAECLPKIADNCLSPVPQTGLPTYCLQRVPEDSRIDWRKPVEEIDRLVRASTRPYAGAHTVQDGQLIRIWDCRPSSGPPVHGAPGQICRLAENRICIVAGDGALDVLEATDDEGCEIMSKLRRSGNKRCEPH